MPAPKSKTSIKKPVKKVRLDGLNLNSPRLHNTLIMIAFALPSSLIAIYYYGMYMSAESELVQFRNNPSLKTQNVVVSDYKSNIMNKEIDIEAPVKVLVLNGTNSVGVAGEMRDNLDSNFSKFDLDISTGDALDLYESTVVVPITDTGKKAAPFLVAALSAEIQEDNDIENSLDADVMVIVGESPANN